MNPVSSVVAGTCVVVLLVVLGVGLLFYGERSAGEDAEGFKVIDTSRVYTVIEAGHHYVIFDYIYRGGIVHSAACPCHQEE